MFGFGFIYFWLDEKDEQYIFFYLTCIYSVRTVVL